MNKEILIQTGEIKANNISARGLTLSVMAIRQGLYDAERSGLADASLTAEKVIMANVEIYSKLTREKVTIPKRQAELISANAEKLPAHEITGTNTTIRAIMGIIAASPTLEELKRLERYLSLKLPTTEKSFRVLKGIAMKNKELFCIPDQNISEQKTAQLVALLIALDKNVIEAIHKQPGNISKLKEDLEKKYRSVTEELIRDGAVEVEDIKNTIADGIVYDLRRNIAQTDSVTRPTSQYEQTVNAIIEDENLTEQYHQARQLTEARQTEYKKIKLPEIARQRAEKRAIQELRLARLLRQRIMILQGNAEQAALISDDKIARQANKYVRKHKDTGLVEKERSKLENELEQLKAAYVKLPPEEYGIEVRKRLLPNEYTALKSLIEGKSERDEVYKLAETRLREKIIEGISEDQIKTALLHKLIDVAVRSYLEAIVPEVVDQAISAGTNNHSSLPNPEALHQNKDEIIAKATSLLIERINSTAANNHNIQDSDGTITVPFRRVKTVEIYSKKPENDTYTDASGLDWNPILETLNIHPAVEEAKFHNLHGLNKDVGETVRLALEYCPLYKPGKLHESSLVETAEGVDDIVSSRVGKKWIATQAVLQTLNNFLRANGRSLELKVTFADWAVLAGTKNDANEEILRQHGKVYREQVSRLCKQFCIPYSFQSMSSIVTNPLQQLGIGQFVIAEDSAYIQNVSINPDVVLQRLGFQKSNMPLKTKGREIQVRQVLKDLLSSCEENITLAKGLVGAYCMTLPILLQDCDIHLGMERSQNLLDLSTLAQSEKALLNILVK